MLHASWDHECLPGLQDDVAVPQLNIQSAVYNEKQLIGVRMRVPDEFAEQLSKLDLIII